MLLFLFGKNPVKPREEKQLISRITQALKEDRFCLYCQKIIVKKLLSKNYFFTRK